MPILAAKNCVKDGGVLRVSIDQDAIFGPETEGGRLGFEACHPCRDEAAPRMGHPGLCFVRCLGDLDHPP